MMAEKNRAGVKTACFKAIVRRPLDFLWGIRFNNDRTWFRPTKRSTSAVSTSPRRRWGRRSKTASPPSGPSWGWTLHISRIYRDARRLHGRGPYKDHLWFSLRPERDAWTHRPVFWFEVAPEGWSYGVGCWNAAPATMAALRRDIDGGGKEIAPSGPPPSPAGGLFPSRARTTPRPKGEPGPLLAPWYNKKSLSIGCNRPFDDLVCSPELADTLVEGFEFLLPYYMYFDSLCKTGLEDLK